jgi:OmcA/MtrC family decaheme c-type cytochrome
MRTWTRWGRAPALALALTLGVAGCSSSGSDGAQGPVGPTGPTGMNGNGGKLSLTLDGVQTVSGTATLTFTIRPAAAVCPGNVCDPNLSGAVIGKMAFFAQEYNTATNTFDTARNINFTPKGAVPKFKGLTSDGTGAQYTFQMTNVTWAPESSAHAFVYGYVTGLAVAPAPTSGHYYLPSSVANAAMVIGSVPYTSTANVAGCEKCHGAPYSKHGYRQATVAGLNPMVSCKACHTDQLVGTDMAWFILADDPAARAAIQVDSKGNLLYSANQLTQYAYTANLMNDVHNSHAFEFNYPQSMANCVTCHANNLASILTQSNFKPSVCKSCHPVNGSAGTLDGRAPSLAALWAASPTHSGWDPSVLYTTQTDTSCNGCHRDGSGHSFADFHRGYNEQIYSDAASANAGTKLSATRKAQIDSASYDAVSYVATIAFSVAGVPTSNSVVGSTVVASLYGYDTKDFIVSGHGTAADNKRNAEWASGGPKNGPRLVVVPGDNAASFVATINLSTWASMISAGQVKRIEVGILPSIGVDPTLAVSTTNPPAVVAGVAQTLDVTETAGDARIADAKVYGKAIVDPAKCNKCHDALGTSFHDPDHGSAGVVGCRLCHAVPTGTGYYEMQSRSIDSFIHAAHSMQYGNISKIDPTNAVSIVRYTTHIEGNYPNFAGPLNCESCHNPGTYDPSDESRSLPGLVSASSNFKGNYPRTIGTFAQEITGPAARACGGCHRAMFINEADGSKLAAFVAHTNDFGSSVMDPTALVSTAAYVQYLIGGSTTAAAPVAGAQVEQCTICHSTAGSQHQTLFNAWQKGL